MKQLSTIDSSSDPLSVPSLMVDRVTNSAVEYQVQRNDGITGAPLITGYEATRFGVPMIGQYVNTGRGRRVTISPAVPGAQYRITAWALGDGRRSATPAVVDATTGEASECIQYTLMCACARTWVCVCVCEHWQQRPFANDHLGYLTNLTWIICQPKLLQWQ